MDIYRMTTTEYEVAMTHSKNTFIAYMVEHGFVDAEQARYLIMNTAILIRKPGFFSNWWDKYFPKEKSGVHYIVVEQKTLKDEEPEEKDPKGKNSKGKGPKVQPIK